MKPHKGRYITLTREMGYPNVKAKVVDYDDEKVVTKWGVNTVIVNRTFFS